MVRDGPAVDPPASGGLVLRHVHRVAGVADLYMVSPTPVMAALSFNDMVVCSSSRDAGLTRGRGPPTPGGGYAVVQPCSTAASRRHNSGPPRSCRLQLIRLNQR